MEHFIEKWFGILNVVKAGSLHRHNTCINTDYIM